MKKRLLHAWSAMIAVWPLKISTKPEAMGLIIEIRSAIRRVLKVPAALKLSVDLVWTLKVELQAALQRDTRSVEGDLANC